MIKDRWLAQDTVSSTYWGNFNSESMTTPKSVEEVDSEYLKLKILTFWKLARQSKTKKHLE